METFIKVKNIEKSYYGKKVLEGITLEIKPGTFYALLGKNGAGKSTLMRILMRHEAPTAGDGTSFGFPFSGNEQEMNSKIGFVSETIEFHVNQGIGDFFKKYRAFYPAWDDGLFNTFLKKFKLDPDKKHNSLSRGQKMQVAFAAAIAIRPKVLFLDEITAVLDASARAYVMEYLGAFCKQGGSVVMATNIVSEVENHGAHLWLIENKSIQVNLPIHEVKNHYLKLRKSPSEVNPFFSNPLCVSVGINSDGSESFVIPKSLIASAPRGDSYLDRREITSEDLFIYFTREKEGTA
jgi:ABC-2 type transport system ATP-binding protein